MRLEPLLVRASAGTGKTYQLTGRLLAILVAGGEVSSILATTFTRKAAGEILQRILTTLADAAEEPDKLDSLRGQVSKPGLTSPQCRNLLHRLMREIHRVRVCTLDSLFSQLARSFPFELQLPPGWRLSDEIEEQWLQRMAIDATLAAIEPNQLASLVSMLGKGDAVRSVEFELRSIVADGYQDARWANPKAWQSLRAPSGPEPQMLADAAFVLRGVKVGNGNADRQLDLIGQDLESLNLELLAGKTIVAAAAKYDDASEPLTYYRKPLSREIGMALRVAYEGARTKVLGLLAEQTKATGEILGYYGSQIEAIKQHQRVLAFDDVAFRLSSWIDSLDFDVLQTRLDAAINHVLLDEFQDTAPVQWAVLKPLAVRSAQPDAERSFFCVGDTKQAIYGWRGGQAAIFDAVAREVPGVQETSQDLSYRSSPVISQFVTELFTRIDRHPSLGSFDAALPTKEDFESRAVANFASQFPTHQSAKRDLPGYVQLSTAPKLDIKGAGAAAAIRVAKLSYVADQIQQLAEQMADRSFGVLTRTNQSVGQLIFLLKQRGVDVSQEGGNPLTDSSLVELVLSALLLCEHPGDLRWAFHVSHSPLGELFGLERLLPGQTVEDIAKSVSQAAEKIRQRIEYHGLSQTLIWLGTPLIAIASEADATRLRQLISLAHTYQMNEQPRLSYFVELVRCKRVERPRPAQVRVMTVHQAKGLEFDVVVLPELDGSLVRLAKKVIRRSATPVSPPSGLLRYLTAAQWGLLPDNWRRAFGENAAAMMTEALCLLYVAVTRPRNALYMIIEPANKASFENRTPAALIYHALGLESDPTAGKTILYTHGDPDWYQQRNTSRDE
ncbi:UvrD-helicase domain-containing protein [Planctomycetaceae bacterium SH139]